MRPCVKKKNTRPVLNWETTSSYLQFLWPKRLLNSSSKTTCKSEITKPPETKVLTNAHIARDIRSLLILNKPSPHIPNKIFCLDYPKANAENYFPKKCHIPSLKLAGFVWNCRTAINRPEEQGGDGTSNACFSSLTLSTNCIKHNHWLTQAPRAYSSMTKSIWNSSMVPALQLIRKGWKPLR